jgi:alkyldihydroxyacetonephosphate synthase
LGVRAPLPHPSDPDQVPLAPPRLDPALGQQLAAAVGSEYARVDDESRLRHALGKSTPDLLRLRLTPDGPEPLPAPDLVLLPADHDQVAEVLRIATEHRIAVVPFGGGTSVVGGLGPVQATEPFAGVVALDLARLNELHSLDEESRVAVLGPGLRGPQAEELLGARGYTIGHFPQSFEYATLGGFAAARSSGQSSAGYGRFDDLVVSMEVASPAGSLRLGRAPKSAAGPDLRQLILGSEGALGVITSLSVQVRPVPERRLYEGWRLPSFADGATALRHLVQDGPPPTVLRLSDEAETALGLARPADIGAGGGTGCLAIVGFEGAATEVERRREACARVLERQGGVPEPGAGEQWARDRYRGPYLRDALLDAGALVETLETVSFWSSLPTVYGAVSEALRESLSARGTPPVILCHISHVYPAGASLYFTVGCAAGEDPLAAWGAAKAAASDAMLAAGGSITHHHGIGRDHLPWYAQEIGPLGMEALRAVKAKLDPAGILNPGALIPRA